MQSDKPSVKVYINETLLKDIRVNQILLGIEEEGIPYEMLYIKNNNAVELAFEASGASRLGVGVGISEKEAVLHYEKLKKDSPLFTIPIYSNESDMRSLGANAARLVKKMPFKSIVLSH